jgi:hypothetical protein
VLNGEASDVEEFAAPKGNAIHGILELDSRVVEHLPFP